MDTQLEGYLSNYRSLAEHVGSARNEMEHTPTRHQGHLAKALRKNEEALNKFTALLLGEIQGRDLEGIINACIERINLVSKDSEEFVDNLGVMVDMAKTVAEDVEHDNESV